MIFGDVNLDQAAEDYAAAALMLAQEAGANESFARYAQAKTARWQNRFIEAADLARQGFEASPPAPMRTQLAWYEANDHTSDKPSRERLCWLGGNMPQDHPINVELVNLIANRMARDPGLVRQ
ncbi:hypothetical protein F8568_045280 [Actinomadura sp. LD22]|uniref:Uncharacterized protein n=1 Tax=Actinomadura physcomitrii TaxID=2650748 RepID=A0A6I4MQX7_9ACTN|nr:hypothetical protein [Actinomadura physcomitrii]MWA07420.1 hypothetical protein [Actinomadura physcomitrii]